MRHVQLLSILTHGLLSSLAYPMMTYPSTVASNLHIKVPLLDNCQQTIEFVRGAYIDSHVRMHASVCTRMCTAATYTVQCIYIYIYI